MSITQTILFPPAGEALNPQVQLEFADLISQLNTSIGATTAVGTANTLAYYTSSTSIGSYGSATISGGVLTLSNNFIVQGSADFQSVVQITAQNGSALAVFSSYAGNELGASITNLSNTSGSGARLFLGVAGSTADDPSIKFRIDGVDDWAIGLDNSDNDKFKISRDFSLGTNDYFTISTSGLTTLVNAAITATTNQLILGTTRTVTLTAPTPATTSRTITFPDLSGNYSVVGTEGTQTINGSKTFSSALTISASSGNTLIVNTSDLVIDSTNKRLGIDVATPLATLDVTGDLFLATVDAFPTDKDTYVGFIRTGGAGSAPFDNAGSIILRPRVTATDGRSSVYMYTGATPSLAMRVDEIGAVRQPLQPSFLVTDGTGASNVTGDGTEYTELWPTEVYDQGADFSSNTFTAPVGGRYALNVTIRMEGMTTSHTTAILRLVTTNRTYAYSHIMTSPPFTTKTFHLCVIADMDAGDTAATTIQLTGGTKVADVVASALANFFSGSLIN